MKDAPNDGARPALLPCLPERIPAVLRANARWAPWRAVWNEKRKKFDKIPHRADRPEYGISTARPAQWAAFDVAFAAWRKAGGKFAGLGYCVTGPHGIVAFDFDDCLAPDGSIKPEHAAAAIVPALASYTERSPSGKGLRTMMLGAISHDWVDHKNHVECYGGNAPRFVTLTGERYEDAPTEVRNLSPDVLDKITQSYARENKQDTSLPVDMPDELDELVLPDISTLPIPDATTRFLLNGEHSGDRSGALHAAGVALYAAGLDDATVFSLLVQNEHALDVALDHRRQDHDRALLYLWREHCVKARAKGQGGRASPKEFDVLTPLAEAPPPLPAFTRDRAGRVEATPNNLRLALQRVDLAGMRIARDDFLDELMIARQPGEWVPFRDEHYFDLLLELDRIRFKPIKQEMLRAAVQWAASNAHFDSAIEWLGGLEWDRAERIERFFADYFGAADSPYTRAVSRYLWTALAGRVIEPGVKADMVPVLIGAQGVGKSRAVAALAPAPDFFVELSFHERDDDLARRMRGKLVGEISELRGLRTRELESIKAFVARTHERWVPKYLEHSTTFARRIVLVGTTNQDEFLADETGNRRWLPIRVQRIDVAAIERDRAQLWAEARDRFAFTGVEFHDAEVLAPSVHVEHAVTEPWAAPVATWLDTPDTPTGDTPRTRKFLRVDEVGREALRLEDKQIGKREEMRIANALRECAYAPSSPRVDGKRIRVWVPVSAAQPGTTCE